MSDTIDLQALCKQNVCIWHELQLDKIIKQQFLKSILVWQECDD